MDEQSPSVKVIIRGQEISNSIIDCGSGVNVISKMTCDHRGITDWEVCPFLATNGEHEICLTPRDIAETIDHNRRSHVRNLGPCLNT